VCLTHAQSLRAHGWYAKLMDFRRAAPAVSWSQNHLVSHLISKTEVRKTSLSWRGLHV
jgi:hypothetical protein